MVHHMSGRQELPTERRSGGEQLGGSCVSDVSAKCSRKKIGALLHGADGARTDARIAAKPQEQIAHQDGSAGELTMGALVMREIVVGHGVGERKSLAEGHAKTFTGDGVDAAGGIAEQSDIVAINT